MRKNKIYLILFSLFAFLWACEKDGEMLIVKGFTESKLEIDKSELVLSIEQDAEVVLSFAWEENNLEINSDDLKAPSSIANVVIEAALNENFEDIESITPKTNPYEMTGLALNTLALNLGLSANSSGDIYFRTKTTLGNNGESKYSDAIKVNVTPYGVNLAIAKILDADKEDTGFTLFSDNGDGIYSGFMSVSSWYNWYLLEGDGSVWGNVAIDGNDFIITNDEEAMWNMWFPGVGGVYLATIDTKEKEWNANYIEEISITGDVDMPLSYVKAENCWLASFTTENSDAKFTIEGTTKLYTASTGTDDENAIDGKITIQPDEANNTFEYSLEADATDFTLGAAGEYTIKLFITDPENLHYEITSGATEIEDPISEYLYAIGVDDGFPSVEDWNFDNYIRLVSEDDSTYAGVLNINSKYGFQFALYEGDWDNVYKLGDEEGKLEFKSEDNIPAPIPGVYLVKADLKNLTYSLTEVANQIYVTGLNDAYNFEDVVLSKIADGVYEGLATIEKSSSYGIRIHLDDSWGNYFGGSFENLVWTGGDITDDQSLDVGDYIIRVDLLNNNCSFTKAE